MIAIKSITKNKKAFFNYEIVEQYEAGMILSGAEVKAVKGNQANLKGSYVTIRIGNGKGGPAEAFVEKMHISPYQKANQPDYDPTRTRKLLLNRKEIDELTGRAQQHGFTIIPLEIVLKSGLIKMNIGLCKGRKKYDKRELLKKRSQEMDIKRSLKHV